MVPARVKRLVQEVIERFELDLSGLTVLTEAATNAYALTPIIAAVAGAEKVFAVCAIRPFLDIRHVAYWKDIFGLGDKVVWCPRTTFMSADVITNLGSVRPITGNMVNERSVVPLMMESWEVREEDVDVPALREKEVPILATNEDVLGIWNYCGPLVLKMLLDKEIELHNSRVLIVGNDKFAMSAFKWLTVHNWVDWEPEPRSDFSDYDVVVVSDWYGEFEDENVIWLTKNKRMVKTLAYLGPRPVIELHTAGLKIGELMARTGLRGREAEESVLEICNFAQAYERV